MVGESATEFNGRPQRPLMPFDKLRVSGRDPTPVRWATSGPLMVSPSNYMSGQEADSFA